jgi:PAS domain S-box-containing protein
MEYNFPTFSFFFFLGGIVALILAGLVWTRRQAPGAIPFVLFSLAVAEWVITRALEAGGVDPGIKDFWGRMMWMGAIFTGVFWLFFSLDFSGSNWWKRTRNIFLVCIIPIISIVMIWTNQYHHYFWTDIIPSPGSSGTILVWQHGFWFWIAIVFQYTLLISGICILINYAVRHPGIYRNQVIYILLGLMIPLVANILFLFGITPVKGLDITPFSFVFAGFVYAYSIFKLRFLDIVPVARNTLVESMPDGVLVLNKDGNLIDINPSAQKMLGLENCGFLEKPLAIVCPSLDMIRSGIGSEGNTEMKSGMGDYIRYFDISIVSLRDKNSFVNGQLIVLRDITERRIIEQNLRESEVRYEALVEQSNDGVLIVQDGIYKYANRTLADISGYSVEELTREALSFAVADEDQLLIKDRYELRNEGNNVPALYELKVVRKDGEPREVEISISSITFEGHPANMITIRDLTDRKLTQKKLENLYKEEVKLRSNLQDEITKRSKYSRALVHELKTPLTSILASGELLETLLHSDTQSALVKNIRRSSLNLEQRINELIELARGETGMIKIIPLPTDMTKIINEIVSEMSLMASSKGLVINTEIQEILPLVQGDRNRLKQVMANLLSNAIKYTKSGRIEIKVGTYSQESLIVQVKDSGRGISAQEMENLFDPYSRKSSHGQELGGLGIGLALCKIFIEAHKGKIWAESIPGQGSTFYFTVPIVKNDDE